ncbi:hypothetical protein [Vulcanisaeta sp. JCM 16159]|uniref:hypothetical protein n=1 Tax=Vulcanisaeta sp. JCM 16159 TaxID=1295371 RepID=UPI0006D11CFF|nr:hypothetical protein [Vulcanisaeta sp. JCM 16159]
MVRALENRLRELETFSVIAGIRRSYEELWYPLLEAEYHDPMGATSTKAVYEEVINELEEDLRRACEELMSVLRKALGTGHSVTIVNPLPWTRRELVMVKEELSGVPTQKVNNGYLTLIEVPALGWRSFEKGAGNSSGDVTVGSNLVENSVIRVVFDGSLRIYDKEAGRWAVEDGT